MHESQFDLLLRKVAHQTTRRAALGALIGGALLLTDSEETDASRRARRRRRRRRRRQRNRGVFDNLRITVLRPNGVRPLNYSTGWASHFHCCIYDRDSTLHPDQHRMDLLGTYFDTVWLWLDDGKFWFEFDDPLGAKPNVSLALNGRYETRDNCCTGIPIGQKAGILSFDRDQTRDVNMGGTIFTITRRTVSGTSSVFFDLTIPDSL